MRNLDNSKTVCAHARAVIALIGVSPILQLQKTSEKLVNTSWTVTTFAAEFMPDSRQQNAKLKVNMRLSLTVTWFRATSMPT